MSREAGGEIPRFGARFEALRMGLGDGFEKEVERSNRAICRSRSSILARFDMFLGFGLGAWGGGVASCCHSYEQKRTLFPLPAHGRRSKTYPAKPIRHFRLYREILQQLLLNFSR